MRIEGVEIFNWEETGYMSNTSHYSPYIKGMGVYSFVVEYAHNRSAHGTYMFKQVNGNYLLLCSGFGKNPTGN